jgi:hypothetical protein
LRPTHAEMFVLDAAGDPADRGLAEDGANKSHAASQCSALVRS